MKKLYVKSLKELLTPEFLGTQYFTEMDDRFASGQSLKVSNGNSAFIISKTDQDSLQQKLHMFFLFEGETKSIIVTADK